MNVLEESKKIVRDKVATWPFGGKTIDAFIPRGIDNFFWTIELYGQREIWINTGYVSVRIEELRNSAGSVYFKKMHGIKEDKKLLKLVGALETKYLLRWRRISLWERVQKKLPYVQRLRKYGMRLKRLCHHRTINS